MENDENKKDELNEISEEKEVVEQEPKQEAIKQEKVEQEEVKQEEIIEEEPKQEEVKEAKVVSNSQEKKTEEANNSKALAIAALVLGIIALLFWFVIYISIPCAVLAIVFGAVGRKKAGKGMAIAGLVLGIITTCLIVLTIIFGISMFSFLFKEVINENSIEDGTFYKMLNEIEDRGIEYDYDYDI